MVYVIQKTVSSTVIMSVTNTCVKELIFIEVYQITVFTLPWTHNMCEKCVVGST